MTTEGLLIKTKVGVDLRSERIGRRCDFTDHPKTLNCVSFVVFTKSTGGLDEKG